MSNDSRRLYQALALKGMSKEDAFFAVLDNFREQHCFDRNSYRKEIDELKAEVAELKGKP